MPDVPFITAEILDQLDRDLVRGIPVGTATARCLVSQVRRLQAELEQLRATAAVPNREEPPMPDDAPIRDDAALDRAIADLDLMLDILPVDDPRVERLGDRIRAYESAHRRPSSIPDADMLRHLIEAKGVTQAEAAVGTGIAESTVSMLLAGKRELTREQVAACAAYFRVSPAIFFDEPSVKP